MTGEYHKESYAFYKQRKRCVLCHQQDTLTLGGYTYCADCVEKHRVVARKYYTRHRETVLEKRRSTRNARIANGLCAMCGKPLPDGCPYKSCDQCRARRKAKTRCK